MSEEKLCITGIGTMVGKTLASAILCERLNADYWKPWGSGLDEEPSDPDVVAQLISDSSNRIHAPLHYFRAPLSPHIAAKMEGAVLDVDGLQCPDTSRPLLIELAGGLMTPLTDSATNLDVIERLRAPVVVVSRHYLGSINHTLMTITALRSRKVEVSGIVFNGDELPDTERVIISMTQLPIIGRIPTLAAVTPEAVKKLAPTFEIEL